MNATLLRVFVAIFTVVMGSAYAQESKLPTCPTNSRFWTDCFGVRDYGKDRYAGEFKDDKRHGHGTYASANGDKYVGDWKGGAESGTGTHIDGLGTKYVGEFKDGMRDGLGTWTTSTGSTYVGEFRQNKRNGKGTYTFPSGEKYVGEFQDGSFHGQGVKYDAAGQIASSGYFENYKLVHSAYVNPDKFSTARLSAAAPNTARQSLEAEQQRQRELEERETRARELERVRTAELDVERKRREQLEEQLRIVERQRASIPPYQQPLNAHALVIGNAAYPGSGRLDNPVNDSRAIGSKLRSLGFRVTEVEDANRAKLVTAFAQFSRSAAAADLSVLFYSGHGVQLLGTNYILPTDIDQSDLAQATIQGISLDSAIGQFLPGKTKLVFLDACRDNPLYQVAANKSFNKGLAPISVAEGTLIAYATKDGQVASDGGKGTKNSPFTVALLEHLSDPDDIAVVLRRVREKVKAATGGKQVPWDYGSLTGGALILSAIKPTEGKK